MRYQGGVSIIEAIIAAAVLGIGLMAAVKMQINMGVATQLSRQRADATLLATNMIEQARADKCMAKEPTLLTTTTQGNAQFNTMGNTQYTMGVTCAGTTMTVTITWNDHAALRLRLRLTKVPSTTRWFWFPNCNNV